MLNIQFEICSKVQDKNGALEAIEETIQVYRPISEQTAAERNGKPDSNLVFYLFNFSALLGESGRLQECVEIYNECKNLLGAEEHKDDEQLTTLTNLIKARQPQIEQIQKLLIEKAAKQEEESKDQNAAKSATSTAKNTTVAKTGTSQSKSAADDNLVDTSMISEHESVLSTKTTSGKLILASIGLTIAAGIGYIFLRQGQRQVNQ